MHPMHGGSLAKTTIPRYTRALREQAFGYQGKLIGREVVAAEEANPGMGAPPPQS
jgi:hypothetical protein